jgi:SAM-dependent methyltransferase
MPGTSRFESLIAEAEEHPLGGWDFSWIRGRYEENEVPWDYNALVKKRARESPDLLDIGTGGGERLASLAPLPARTVATESYPPNVPIARRRLAPLGVEVIWTSAAPGNQSVPLARAPHRTAGLLPFRDESFHLVIDRNEAFLASEVARVLVPGGRLVIEMTGGSHFPELCESLGLPVLPNPFWMLSNAKRQLRDAGLKVTRSEEAYYEMSFMDVGALVWYLRMIPWAAPGFSVRGQRERLRRLHLKMEKEGPIRIPRYGFWLEALKGK